MAARRRYDDGCAMSHALDLVGERWGLLVVRELLFGPKRFTDLRAGMPGVSPDVLAQRLRELEAAGVVRRRKLAPPAASRVYELTDWGTELEPITVALGRWGARSPSMRHDVDSSTNTLLLALKALFDPGRAVGHGIRLALVLGEERFRIRVGDGAIEITRDDGERPDATVESEPATLEALLWEGHPLADALDSGTVRITGDREPVERFLTLFPLPEPVAAVASP